MLLFLMCCSLPLPAAETFCAVRIEVKTDSGRAVSNVPAYLFGPGGAPVETSEVRAGKVEFCDFGFGKHSIQIGDTNCGATVVKNVEIEYRRELKLFVILNSCNVGGDTLANACFIYVRVRDAQGNKIGSVQIVNGSNPKMADEFGRAEIAVRQGESRKVTFVRDDFVPEVVEFSCGQKLSYRREQEVVLIRR